MGEDIGPGDVVEAVDDSWPFYAKGDRTVVVAVVNVPSDYKRCEMCKDKQAVGLLFSTLKLPRAALPDGSWCPNHWRKIGGSQADTVARFRESLNVAPVRPKVDA